MSPIQPLDDINKARNTEPLELMNAKLRCDDTLQRKELLKSMRTDMIVNSKTKHYFQGGTKKSLEYSRLY